MVWEQCSTRESRPSGESTCKQIKEIREDSPLHISAKAQIVDVVRALLEQGADPCCRDAKGKTALHIAAGATEV
eukprot:5868229-Pyramimonas_sp.AAC.1